MANFGLGLRQATGALRSRIGEHGVAPWICPECGQAALFRSRAVSRVERFGRAVRLHVYRCHDCGHRQFHLRVASADGMASHEAVPAPLQPRAKREAVRPAALPRLAAAVAGGARGVWDLARGWYQRTRLRTLIAALLVAVAGGGLWVLAPHRLALWQRGKEAVSAGDAWWNGARARLAAVSNDLKHEASPPPAPAPIAATQPAESPNKRPPTKRRTRPVAKVAGKAAAASPAPPAAAQAPAIVAGGAAWRSARWGMTVEEVLAVFPSEAVRSGGTAHSSASLAERAAIERASLGTVTGRVSFLFGSDGKLAAIAATPDAFRDAAQTYRELASWLSSELGWPTTRDPRITAGSRVDATDWSTPDTAVHLSLAQAVQQDARVLAIDLSNGEIRAVPERVDLWYEPARSTP